MSPFLVQVACGSVGYTLIKDYRREIAHSRKFGGAARWFWIIGDTVFFAFGAIVIFAALKGSSQP